MQTFLKVYCCNTKIVDLALARLPTLESLNFVPWR